MAPGGLCTETKLAAGTCEIVTLDRDSSQPRRTIARQTARCACKKGQIAGTTRARPACVDGMFDELEVDQHTTGIRVCEMRHEAKPNSRLNPVFKKWLRVAIQVPHQQMG
ncbi:putative protein FAM19A5-like [Scophthalmus maximus]|uniref:Protein FAM19A5 n=1 Tax=Scophthalmus maximus TaxID=52904 RepID=A0A2U9B2F0_SCOMX|nr:putative protein FAM19A5-like [Scophthalmus maximus]